MTDTALSNRATATPLPAQPAPLRLDSNMVVLLVGGILLGVLALHSLVQPGGRWQFPALVLVGAAIGFVLFRSSFGFSAAFRSLLVERNAHGIRVQAIMLIVTTLAFLPLISAGSIFGMPVYGSATPVGVAFVIGAIMFGIGMQISGGCASGTLFVLGGGNARLLMTLAFFVVGSTVGAAHMDWWWGLPKLPSLVIQNEFGLWPALIGQVAVLGLIVLIASRFARPPALETTPDPRPLHKRLLVGPWPLLWGGLALAALNVATLILSSRPWGETAAFVLWGSKIAAATGLGEPHFWEYWGRPGYDNQLDESIFLDITTLMDFAIILGAALAAASAGVFRLHWGGGLRPWIAAAIGGFAMGYGARLTNGCNISAYFSAIGAGNISGFLWVILAIGGSAIGIWLRPLFGLSGRKEDQPAC